MDLRAACVVSQPWEARAQTSNSHSHIFCKKKSTDKEMILTFVGEEESKLLLCLVI